MRGYVRKYEDVKDESAPYGFRWDVWFTNKEAAMHWETLEEAKGARDWFEKRQIQISLLDGRRHLCRDFQIEERKAGEFVIFCDAPFRGSES